MKTCEGNEIAIVGMACLFPGAASPGEFWRNIVNKVDAITDPPENAEDRYLPHDPEAEEVYCRRGGYLGDLCRFDPMAYGIVPNTVNGTEPEHFLALRVADEALRDAGFPEIPLNRERTEVIVGRGTFANRAMASLNQHGYVIDQTLDLLKKINPGLDAGMLKELHRKLKASLPPLDAQTAPGIVSSITSGRIANRLDLKGVNYCVDGACASSLIAVEHAAQDLRSGKCDAVLAGSVQFCTNIMVLRVFCELGALSRSKTICPFDLKSDGTLLGDGAGMVVLKRRADAERDGNRIYALIKAVGSSSDGRAKSIVAPRREGQELALKRAYGQVGFSPETISLIEAHGTSMSVGDATELQTLHGIFEKHDPHFPRCALGSVKSMIGHLIPAAGMASLIKTALALHHKILPPSIHCDEPVLSGEPHPSFFYVNTEARPWIHGARHHPRRAGINAFGFGGVNAHAILEEVPAEQTAAMTFLTEWESELCVISGASRADMVAGIRRLAGYLERHPETSLKDIAYTLNTGLEGRPWRLSLIVGTREELAHKLQSALKKLADPSCARIKVRTGAFYFEERLAETGKIAFVFPGEGSQYINMLSSLCQHFPIVRECFDQADCAFLEEGRDDLLSDIVFPPPTGLSAAHRSELEKTLWQMEAGVQAVNTANRALRLLFVRLGIVPDAVAGHSSGEFAALEASGIVPTDSPEELRDYIRRGKQSVREVSALGEKLPECVLVAVGAEDSALAARVAGESNGRLMVAMDNCPFQVILCGPEDAMHKAIATLNAQGGACTKLPFHRPYHTALFSPACKPLADLLAALPVRPARIPIYSCATAGLFPQEPEAIRQLAVAQWTQAVRFRETILRMHDDGVRVFIEVGPGTNLTSFINDVLKEKPFVATACNIARKPELTQLHHALGLMIAHGVTPKLDYLYERRSPRRLDFNAPAPGPKREIPRLELSLPRLTLKPEDVEKLRAQIAPPSAAPPGFIANGERPLPLIDDAALERSRALKSHFSTMEQFLRSQEQVMHAMLSHVRSAPPETVASKGYQDKSHKSYKKNDGPIAKSPSLPFAGKIMEQTPGERQVVRRNLSVDREPYLKDHVLGGKVSFLDPDLLGLPVNPLTMSIEMLAQAAVELMPHHVVTAIRKVRAGRWVVVAKESLTVETVATHRGAYDVHVVLRDADAANPFAAIYVEAVISLSPSYPEAPVAPEFRLSQPVRSRFSAGNVYTTGMFNGPSFQGIASIEEYSEEGSRGTIRALPSDKLFSHDPGPKLVAEGILIDSIGQLLAHWNAEKSSTGFNIFPYRVEEILFFGPMLPPPAAVDCRLTAENIGDNRYRMNAEAVLPNGRTHLRVTGWEVVSLPLPETFYGILHDNPRIVLGDAWPLPVASAGLGNEIECRRVDRIPQKMLLDSGRIWLRALACQILSREERRHWENMPGADAQRCQWLLGRAAVKDAVRTLLLRCHGLELCPADIEIFSDDHGRPYVGGLTLDHVPVPPVVSLSHKRDCAVAVAAVGSLGLKVGIDIEPTRTLDPGVIDFSFDEQERALMATLPATAHWPLRFWCAKEAAGKAAGIGLSGTPRHFIVTGACPDTETVQVEAAPQLRDAHPEMPAAPFNIITRQADRIVCAFCWYKTDLSAGCQRQLIPQEK
jgi:acyl transferase domain-containing protein/phosphopantetheinyl transferase